ncbi:GDSL-type esterase/lipase family protein [Brevifollis gellanilyticus]|uniref:GDSL-type esterase/lipase family protein n=1 Tax=Brevifollis gellanilyticus TaxID=748831 RepID=UPI0014781F93|nr:GDSL-type esterase/lipase family protein [Brevifollis gellanilyticus]
MRLPLLLSLLAVCMASFAARPATAPILHPKASALPFPHQGPFVTAADGAALCFDAKDALRSTDEGATWTSTPLFATPEKFQTSNERALLRTREGVIIAGWMNMTERGQPKGWRWGEADVKWTDFVLPTYTCRSTDDGKTWETPVKLSDPWCGCIHSMIQMRSGRIVMVGQEIIPEWRHATVMWVSDDLGKSWQRSNMLDYGVGTHDHAGSLEGAVIERKDGSLYLLLRTEAGFLWDATSKDGLKWEGLKQTNIASVTCCPQMARLSDGRIALLWNAPPRHAPKNGTSRSELSLAFSSDEAATWSKPVIVAANYGTGARVSYPYLYERSPGEVWITTMQGGLRMKVKLDDLNKGEIPVHVPIVKPDPKPGGIIMFGDSTTAVRSGIEKVYADRVQEALQSVGSSLAVYNAGVPGNTTSMAMQRLESDVLRHKPRLVVIQFGINDSAVDVWKNPPATSPRVPVKDYLKNLRQMISTLQKQDAKVILMTTNPLRWTARLKQMYGKPPYDAAAEDGFESPNLVAYNAAMRELAAELKVPLVDVHAEYPAFAKKHQTDVSGMLPDGMHPNDLGHELVTELLVPAIKKVLQ